MTIGCPVGEGQRECMRGCGGWYKAYNSQKMLKLLEDGKLNPSKMPCGTLKARAKKLLGRQKIMKDRDVTVLVDFGLNDDEYFLLQ